MILALVFSSTEILWNANVGSDASGMTKNYPETEKSLQQEDFGSWWANA